MTEPQVRTESKQNVPPVAGTTSRSDRPEACLKQSALKQPIESDSSRTVAKQ